MLAALCSQSEVEYFHDTRGCNHDVGRLQIAMGDAFFVRSLQSIGDLLGVVERCLDGQRTFESLTRDQFHHQRAVFHSVNLRAVGMVQRR